MIHHHDHLRLIMNGHTTWTILKWGGQQSKGKLRMKISTFRMLHDNQSSEVIPLVSIWRNINGIIYY